MHGTNQTLPFRDEKGFSLVELLVAMVVTLIVTGAMYGLLASGQTAFRREPEMADRQQNIRVAMDLISRDIANGGEGMPPVSQAFTANDGGGGPALNAAGPQGVLGAAGVAARVDVNDNSDILEVVGAEESCPYYTVCLPQPYVGTAAVNPVSVNEWIPAAGCLLPVSGAPPRGLVLVTDNTLFGIQSAQPGVGAGACAGGGANRGLNLGAPLVGFNPGLQLAVGGGVSGVLHSVRIARYVIANNPDPADPTPALWRSTTGRFDVTGAVFGPPPAALPAAANNPWQMVARGIEDLQVEYLNGGGAWANTPGAVPACGGGGCAAANWTSVVRQVRVTISARALAPLLAGGTNPAGGPAPGAIRGQLTSIITPRAALMGLQSGGQFP